MLSITILIVSIGLSLILKLVRKIKNDEKKVNIMEIGLKNRSECPQCGTIFDSKPKYCYNCNIQLKEESGEIIGSEK